MQWFRPGLTPAVALAAALQPAGQEQVLKPVGEMPAAILTRFELPVTCARTRSGEYIVLDRRAHTVYAIDPTKTKVRRVVQIGLEKGRVLQPAALALGGDDIIAVADAPAGFERIQLFTPAGSTVAAFVLDSKVAARLSLGPIVLSGIGSMAFTGRSFFISRPEAGALFAELDFDGNGLRQFGALRKTGFEADRDLHLALNIGLPLLDPTGGFYFVFQTGRPMFRKYDAAGALVFERHIEGVELDAEIQTQPTSWPRRETEGGTFPLVPPVVRTAAVDPTGRLWVSLMAPVTYVYDRRGDKVRTVVFDAGAPISPSSFFFTSNGRVIVTPGCLEFPARTTP